MSKGKMSKGKMSKKHGRILITSALRGASRPENRLLGELGQQLIAFCAFLLAGGLLLLVPSEGRILQVLIMSWNVAAVVYLSLEVSYILRGTPEQTKRWATSQASPRTTIVASIVGRALGVGAISAATILGLITAIGLLQHGSAFLRVLGATTVILAWLIVQTSYGSYYAYLYYRNETPRGLVFPGDSEPGLVDFCYFAIAVGTAFAVSDVQVTETGVRQVVIGHSLLSFVYNAALLTLALATMLRVAAG